MADASLRAAESTQVDTDCEYSSQHYEKCLPLLMVEESTNN